MTSDVELLTVPEAMARLKISRSPVYDLIRTRQLASITLGRARSIPAHALTALIRHQQPRRTHPHRPGSLGALLTYWLESVAVHRLRDQPQCCAIGACCRKRLSPLTLAYVHSVLKSALEHAVREEEIPRDVARNVCMGMPRPRRFEPLTAEKARAFLAVTSGQRLSALTQGSERRIALRTPCQRSLKQHRDRQLQERGAVGTAWKDSGYISARPDGAPIEGSTLTRHFTALLRQAGLRRIRFHDLRHSTATLLLEQGVELVVIKELLGHAHIGVTATVYAHVRLRLQRNAIDLLGRVLRNPPEPVSEPDDGDDPPLCASPVR